MSNIEPRHYTDMKIAPNVYIRANKIEWYEANAIKYISRWRNKNGIEDIRKAIKYLELLIKEESEDECSSV